MPPAGGVLVTFKAEDTGDILWTGIMNSVPSLHDLVWYAELGDPFVEYKVEAVGWEFRKPKAFDPEAIVATELCQHAPVITVSLVP